jgi:multisubunit Na+/H+ antiporter MnhE subunit
MPLIQEQTPFEHYRDGTSFQFQREITRPFGDLDDILAWCKAELQGDWRWQLIDVSTDLRPGTYKFYFDSERDCVAFVLQWS